MAQAGEARKDIDAILELHPDEEAAILLRGKISEAQNDQESARSGLSERDRGQSVQRTGVPLSGTAIHRTKETGRSHRTV